MSRTVTSAALLVAVYLLMLRSADPLDIVAGCVVAAGALAVGGRPRGAYARRPPLLGRLAGLPLLVGSIARDVLAGTVAVTLTVLGLRPADRDGLVEIPIGERTDDGIVATSVALTLSPGEVLVDVDRERGVLLVHVLDATDPEAVRRRHQEFYERRQRRVVP